MKYVRHCIALTTLAAVALSAYSAAQSAESGTEEDRWYNVELIIFSRTSPSAANSETWEPVPDLSYPSEYRILGYPDSNEATDNPELVPVQTTARRVADALSFDALSLDEILDPNQARARESIPRPTPFIRLAQDKWEFSQRARRMAQSGRYEILFHERWNQPFVSSEDTLPILLDESGYLQEWPKLQGSIKLYLARYLHLETNFWVNTMGSYLPGDWQMPAPPLGPNPYPIAEEEEHEVAQKMLFQNQTEPTEGTINTDSELSSDFAAQEPVDVGPTYPWRHAVLMQQTRKMRSEEVHYLDHPMMGVIVLVTPITDEELDALAIEEFGLDPNQPL